MLQRWSSCHLNKNPVKEILPKGAEVSGEGCTTATAMQRTTKHYERWQSYGERPQAQAKTRSEFESLKLCIG